MEKILITGGVGFIGSNLASRLLAHGHAVTIFDNFSRPGSTRNLEWLQGQAAGSQLTVIQGDVADFERLTAATAGATRIYHLAGQVAVTTSVAEPRRDFLSNALGTFNMLEAARIVGADPVVIYASTNKVYGKMEHIQTTELESRYAYVDHEAGLDESQPLDFHSPYGCSKGAGDQYVRDYARIYGLRTVVARQSCIYGRRQFGVEDQGWVAWFMIAALKGRPISIYGNGKQVRDVLAIDDLLDAYDLMVEHIDVAAGQVYNIGGGPANSVSIWTEFGSLLETLLQRPLLVNFKPWRPGDQKVYVSDIRRAQAELGWTPRTGLQAGTSQLFQWIQENQSLFDHL